MAANAVRNIRADYDAAIFFDNAQVHIDQVASQCPRNIQLVKIDESTPHIGYTKFNAEPLASYLTEFRDNKYFNFLPRLGFNDDRYDEKSGITPANIETGKAWLSETSGIKSRAAIFDWDRTLTKMEGILNLKDSRVFSLFGVDGVPSYDEILKESIPYLFGGAARLTYLRDFMRLLHDNDVDIYVLTNNGSCGTIYFKELVEAFFQEIPVTAIVCSKNFRGQKGVALARVSRFGKICRFYGGKRRLTKRRRVAHVKKRRATRRV
jgi:hypothetical protein